MLNELLLWKQIIWFDGVPETLTSSSAQGQLKKAILNATIFKDSGNMSLYSGNSVRWTHAVYSLYGLRSGKAFTQHFHYSDSLGISLSEHVALLSSSIPADSEISFCYNIFAARIAKKLGFHTKVQVTDFVSRLATRQHCRAEASESSWGGFCRST